MNQFQVLSFDPGGATGWAYTYFDGVDFNWTGDTIWEPQHHKGLRALIWAFWEHSHDHKANYRGPLHVVKEHFEFRKNPQSAKRREGLELISRNYEGVIELACMDLDLEWHDQKPSFALDFFKDEKLAAVNLLEDDLHENRHLHDARRHLLAYLVRTLLIREPFTTAWKAHQ